LLVALWMARRPLATRILEREFERRGVQATYKLDRVGLRTQQVSNLVIGDSRRPDLVARWAQVQVRVKWNGSVEVYRIVARGVRLRGRFVRGRVSWGQVDKLLPPPSGKPFALPDFTVDVADTSIALATPNGPVGFALEGSGNLTGGFKGRLAVRSPILVTGRCRVNAMRANVAVEVVARRPHLSGPIAVNRLTCPSSRFDIVEPMFNIDSRFNESFTNFDGRGRMAIKTLTAGENGLAAFVGDLTFKGDMDSIRGQVKLSARQSRMAAIYADRTRLNGRYRLGYRAGTFVMVGGYAAESSTLDPSMLRGITGPLAATEKTPIGPIAVAIGKAISATTRNFNATGGFRMVNFPGGGAVRVDSANVGAASGARVQVAGGDGITYYWPNSRIRIDTSIAMRGGGLPTGRITLRQPRNGAPMSGVAEFAPYQAGNSRLALAPIRFAAARDGSTQISTIAVLDGPFPDGRIQGLRVPVSGRLGQNGSFAVGTGCVVVSFASLRMSALQVGPTRLPV
jgi:translocation and assembly module TamB